MSTTQAPGFAPDSVYAEWSRAQREASDRVEADRNRHRASLLALADAKRGHPVRGLTDDGLNRLSKEYRRQLEDIQDGTLHGGKAHERLVAAKLHDIECEQEIRVALAESWLAREDGTHSYTSYHARGGLAAVLDHGATAPSYDLAVTLDWENWKRGLPCVLGWES